MDCSFFTVEWWQCVKFSISSDRVKSYPYGVPRGLVQCCCGPTGEGKAGWGQNRRERTAGQTLSPPTPAPGHLIQRISFKGPNIQIHPGLNFFFFLSLVGWERVKQEAFRGSFFFLMFHGRNPLIATDLGRQLSFPLPLSLFLSFSLQGNLQIYRIVLFLRSAAQRNTETEEGRDFFVPIPAPDAQKAGNAAVTSRKFFWSGSSKKASREKVCEFKKKR